MDSKVNYIAIPIKLENVPVDVFKSKYTKVDIPVNRCPFIDEIEAVKNGYTKKDAEDLKDRANNYAASFMEGGYCVGKPFVVAYCKENESYFLVDGIGRNIAMTLIELRKAKLPFDVVPVNFYECPTMRDLREFTRHNNVLKQKSWTPKNTINSLVQSNGDPEMKSVYNDLIHYQEEVIKTKSEHVVGAIYFGDKYSKLAKMTPSDFTVDKLVPYYEARKEAYAIFVNKAGVKNFSDSKIGNKTRDTVVRGQNPGILLESYWKFIERLSCEYNLDVGENIIESANMIVKRWDNGNVSEQNFFNTMTLNKSHKMAFAANCKLIGITMSIFRKKVPEEIIERRYLDWVTGNSRSYKKVQYKNVI